MTKQNKNLSRRVVLQAFAAAAASAFLPVPTFAGRPPRQAGRFFCEKKAYNVLHDLYGEANVSITYVMWRKFGRVENGQVKCQAVEHGVIHLKVPGDCTAEARKKLLDELENRVEYFERCSRIVPCVSLGTQSHHFGGVHPIGDMTAGYHRHTKGIQSP